MLILKYNWPKMNGCAITEEKHQKESAPNKRNNHNLLSLNMCVGESFHLFALSSPISYDRIQYVLNHFVIISQVHCNGAHHSTSDGSLKMIGDPVSGLRQSDKLGGSNVTVMKYGMRDAEQQLVASFREYDDISAAVFSQVSA